MIFGPKWPKFGPKILICGPNTQNSQIMAQYLAINQGITYNYQLWRYFKHFWAFYLIFCIFGSNHPKNPKNGHFSHLTARKTAKNAKIKISYVTFFYHLQGCYIPNFSLIGSIFQNKWPFLYFFRFLDFVYFRPNLVRNGLNLVQKSQFMAQVLKIAKFWLDIWL